MKFRKVASFVSSRAPARHGGGPARSSRWMVSGPPALGPVPESPSPPKGCTPTAAPIMFRFTFDVSRVRASCDVIDGFVDAGVDAERQAVSRAVDLLDEAGEAASCKADNMQNRRRRPRAKALRSRLSPRALAQRKCLGRRAAEAGSETECGSGGRRCKRRSAAWASGDRSPARCPFRCARISKPKLGHRALEHIEDAVRDAVLKAKNAERRAALAGQVESRGERIAHHLLRERGRIHNHGILSTSFSNERDIASFGKRSLNEARHRG